MGADSRICASEQRSHFLLLAMPSQSLGMLLYKNMDQCAGPWWLAPMAAGLCSFHQSREMTAPSAARDPSGISSLQRFAFPQFHSGVKYVTLCGISVASGVVFCLRRGFRAGTIVMDTLNSIAVHFGCLNSMFPDTL